MWGNFRNVGNAMKALGNVVAPPVDDDDNDDDDDEYYNEDDEDEGDGELEEADDIDSIENDTTDEQVPEQASSPLQKYGFGIVGMIAGALERDVDDEYEDEDEYYDEDEEDDDDDDQEVVELYRDETPNSVFQDAAEMVSQSATHDPEKLDDTGHFTPPLSSSSSLVMADASTPPRQRQQDDGWDDIHTTWENHGNAAAAAAAGAAAAQINDKAIIAEPLPPNVTNDKKMEQRRSILRETGSVSPIVSSRKSLQSSPSNPTSPSQQGAVTATSADHIIKSLQSKLPDLSYDNTESTETIPGKTMDSSKTTSKHLSSDTAPTTPMKNEPETVAPEKEKDEPPSSSSPKTATPREQQQDEDIQQRRSSKVSLSDARFLAEAPRAESLEHPDRWGAPKSTSVRQKKRANSKERNTTGSGHSVDSYFDDSSLSSKSSHDRLGSRKGKHARSASSVPVDKVEKQQMNLSASSPSLSVSSPVTTKKEKCATSPDKARDRHRSKPARQDGKDLLVGDERFATTRSHVAPPPEPQRQASERHWSNGSSKKKTEMFKTNIADTEMLSSDYVSLVSEGAGSLHPPRTPIRQHSGEQTPPISEDEPRQGRRPPLVAGNNKDGDVLPRRPVQRMHSLTEEQNAHKSSEIPQSDTGTKTSSNNGPMNQREGQLLDDLQRRCMELETMLEKEKTAKQSCENKLTEEAAARESLLKSFREKEARLIDATSEEYEQKVRELEAEMEQRVEEVSSLLEDQMKQHETDRAEWQILLNKAEDKIEALQHGKEESRGMETSSEYLSSLVKDQHRQHEQERAEWQDLLRDMENEIRMLKAQKGDNNQSDVSVNISNIVEEQQRQHEKDKIDWQERLREAEEQLESLEKEKQREGDLDSSEHASSTAEDQRRRHEQDRAKWQELLNQAQAELEIAQKEKREILAKLENAHAQNQQRQDRALRIAEDKLAQTLAILDEREEQIGQLKSMVQSMSVEVNEHREGVQEVEDEADELRHQNEVLQHRLDTALAECSQLHEELSRLQSEADQVANLKMELRLLKEDRQRQRAKTQSMEENATTNTAKLASERDAALAEASTLRQQLAASQADIEIAQQDAARALKANENLQLALEAIQAEREAELNLLEDQRRSLEESMAAAHAAALEATHEANEARVREVQAEGHAQVLEAKAEIQKLEEKLEAFRAENVQMRRSLDQAISHLQHNQEDVIDRTLMKNILLDWLTKNGRKEKRQILELMASVLHFTEEEKGRVHIRGEEFSLGKVVATVAAPPPPSKADVEHLEGSNVREKWVNFLLAETDD